MKKNHPLKKTLEEIHSTETYEKLDQFKHPAQWKDLAHDDLHLLANLFIKKGTIDLEKGEELAQESFEIAIKLTREEPYLLLVIAKIWVETGRWDRAIKLIEYAIDKNPPLLEGYIDLVDVLCLKGKTEQDEEAFEKALAIFDKLSQEVADIPTESLSESEPSLPPALYFKWGEAYQGLARLSQEPCDLTHACEKYFKAEELGFVDKYLFFQHAVALSELASRVGRGEFVHESLMYALKAVEVDPHFHEGWIYVAVTYHFLYESGDKPDYYDRAESAFYTASRLDPKSKPLWLSWGQMLLNEGRMKRNHETVSLAIEKFERAIAFFPDDRDVHCFLADALMVLGLFEERYELLKEAKDKIEQCLRTKPDDPAVLFLYGTCLVHLGKYFSDDNLIKQSFDKFEKSLQLNAKDPHVWHSLALAHYCYGEMTEDPIMLEKAVQLFDNSHKLMSRPDSELFNNWGVALMKLSEVTGDLLHVQVAADKFEQAIAHHQNTRRGQEPDPEWFYNYGCALDYLGDFYQDPSFYEKAAQILGHVVNTFPQYNQARYNLALALTHLGDAIGDMDCLDQGLHHFELLRQEDPEDETVLADMGVALIAMGELAVASEFFSQSKSLYEDAESKLLQAISLGSKGSFYWLGCLYSLNGNIPDSLHYLERARDADAIPTKNDLEEEKWLEALRNTEMWPHFLHTIIDD